MKHLSRYDIETIAAKYIKAYMQLPEIKNTQVYRIDPEIMLGKILGLTVDYVHLSYDGSILGLTSFGELGVQIFENDDDEAFYFLDGKTVLVEADLNYDNKLRGRKNFTLMHEGSHQIFKKLFRMITALHKNQPEFIITRQTPSGTNRFQTGKNGKLILWQQRYYFLKI